MLGRVNVLQLKATRDKLVFEKVGFITHCSKGENRFWELWNVSLRGCLKEAMMGFGLQLSDLGESPRKQGFDSGRKWG